MPKTAQSKSKTKSTKIEETPKKEEHKNSFWDIFKFGESYTSLILGIFVVVIATIILLTFVRGSNPASNSSGINQQNVAVKTQDIIQKSEKPTITEAISGVEQKITTITPTKKIEQKNPTVTKVIAKAVPTKKVAPTITVAPTKSVTPTKKVAPTITVAPTKSVTPTKTIAKVTDKKVTTKVVAQKQDQTISGASYTVVEGDNLWIIAEKKYKSGYNWVDIREANKLSNSDKLAVGQKLILPDVKAKVATAIQTKNDTKNVTSVSQSIKITGSNYTVAKGDTLWDIAVRSYGDGYAWQKIASANKLSNPSIIHTGNKLIIPRA